MNKNEIMKRIDALADSLISVNGIDIALYRFTTSMRRNIEYKDNLLKCAVYSRTLERYFEKYNINIKNIISSKFSSELYANSLSNMDSIITKDSYLNLLPDNMTIREKQVVDSCSVYLNEGIPHSKYGIGQYGNIRVIGLVDKPNIDAFTIHGIIFLCTAIDGADKNCNAELRQNHNEFYIMANKDIQPDEPIRVSKSSIIKYSNNIPIEVMAYIKNDTDKDLSDSVILNTPVYKLNRLLKDSKVNRLMLKISSYTHVLELNGVDINALLYEVTDYVPLEKEPKDEDILNALVKTVYKYYILESLNYNNEIISIITGTMNVRDFISFLFNNIDRALELIDSDEFSILINKEHHTKSLVVIDNNNLATKVDILKGTYILRCNSTFSNTKQHRWDIRFLFVRVSNEPNSRIEEYIADKPHPFELRVISNRDIEKGEPITISYEDLERFNKILDYYSIFDTVPYIIKVRPI